MKYFYSTLIFLSFSILSQAQRFDWATSGGYQGVANSFNGAVDIAVDPDGNIYTMDYGNGMQLCQGQTFSQFDSYTAFIYKFNAEGELLLVNRIGAEGGDFYPYNIECDDQGNIYILGQPNGVTEININENIVAAAGNTNQLIKINSEGIFQWKINTGYAGNGQGRMLQYNNGFIYYQSGHLTISKISTEGVIDPNTLQAIYYNSPVASNGPLFKGSGVFSNGDLLFAAYSYGDVAYTEGDTLFHIDNPALTAPFLFVRCDAEMNIVWAKYMSNGRNPDKYVIPVAIDANDDIYACVQVNSSMTVGADVIDNSENIFTGIGSIIKLNENGEGVWGRPIEATEQAYGWCIEPASDGSGIFVGGGYYSDADFDGILLNSTFSPYPFIAKMNTEGQYSAAFSYLDDPAQTDALCLKSTANGRYVVGGKLPNPTVTVFSCTEIDEAKGFYLGVFSEQPDSVPDPSIIVTGNVLTATPAFEGGIQWYLNGEPIENANEQTLQITESGNYSVTYEYLTGCIGSEASEVVLASYTGVDALTSSDYKLFPNPGNGLVQWQNESTKEVTSIAIFNILGEHVLTVTRPAKNTTLDLRDVPSGQYLVRVTTSDHLQSYLHYVKL
jgi:hypothetical protein